MKPSKRLITDLEIYRYSIITYTSMFAQYQKRKENFKQYREKNKERLQQTKETRLLMKRIKIG